MTTTIDGDSVVSTSKAISDADSPYTTQGEDILEVDTSSAAVTVTLASMDADAGRIVRIIDVGDNASTNAITVQTEGSETIDPGNDSTQTIAADSGSLVIESDGSNWFAIGGTTASQATAAAIDDTDSPYTTQGEDILEVDTSSGTVTVTLASADAAQGHVLRILDVGANAGTNAITVNTEGSETIDPGDAASKTIDLDSAGMVVESDGSNWFSNRHAHFETIRVGSDTISDFTGTGLSVSSGTLNNDASTTVTAIDDTDSPYTTQGEDILEVDTSSAAVTVTLASADATQGHTLRVIDDGSNAATNNITVNTEGSETIDPGAASSKAITVDDAELALESNGTNWNATNRNQDAEQVTTDDITFPSELYQDVTGSRTSDTWETNNTNYTLHVRSEGISGGAADDTVTLQPHVNSTQSNRIIGQARAQASTAVTVNAVVEFIVAPGDHYKVDFQNGSLNRWFEAKIGDGS